ncbi:Putative membrane protein OS=Xanthomonas translucens pv. graminis ART-Xtg29 GN=XTG29_00015 PE=4 SV=1 [Tuwongella immobilis]|uniref:Uncharacterized protein n=2 Tax=Tuwongella immobilis TaxID=692036 RepID=A0A6C2YJ09_9BACT|nr:Putative membrane protein OS=Xanthomonas translucens pv. graminis ART-Xtg29 GN=XTG29_00015 PE=4 SV=1 [Tuwongella immobilis]VTR98682.1 Putative membrane protein OS=Xanthomonas translucens pv. graminis ART-Xtg29 GN=XTG29_00015 PE=4 SV=1 [Tuwongella immobilis]
MLGSLRLPLLFQEFDAEAERTTLKILAGLGRFEGSADLSEITITNVLANDGLRARLASNHTGEEEITMIRDALLEETNRRFEEEKQQAKRLETELRNREASILSLDTEKKSKEDEIARLQAEIAEQKALVEATGSENQSQAEIIAAMTAKQEATAALVRYIGWLVFLIVVAGFTGWTSVLLFPVLSRVISQQWVFVLSALIAFIVGHLAIEYKYRNTSVMKALWLFVQVQRFRAWLWSFVFLSFIVGVIGNLVANNVQTSLDDQSQPPGTVLTPAPDATAN